MKSLLIVLFLACCCSTALAVAPTAQPAQDKKSALDYMEEGSALFLKHEYKRAISPYQKALDLEKATPTLDKALWLVLVDNLGMAYGISGDLKQAKATFAYGISKEPDYPLFYYNMACTYGELKDMDKAIEYLKLAFERKKNMIAGEEFPDPATDSSFESFMKDQKFLSALRELKKQ